MGQLFPNEKKFEISTGTNKAQFSKKNSMERNQANSGQQHGDAGVAVSTVGHTSAVAPQEHQVMIGSNSVKMLSLALEYENLDRVVQISRSRMSSSSMAMR